MNPFATNLAPRHRAAVIVLILSAVGSVADYAQAKPGKDEARTSKRESSGEDSGGKPKKRDDISDPRRTKANPAEAQARVLDRLREKLDVIDDTEWALILERMTTIDEIRRTLWTSSASARGSLPGTEKNKRSSGSSGNPERDALRSAVSDNLPDAEIKSRLAHAHEIHKKNEARLAQAQANLRAVLSIRQEAVVVMAGILPP
ncbi:MAG: hypothetical protein EXS40_02485 [Opitutaceae bacterium]|nr:hypothetical protein [Opitutaceae bacterium]